MPAQRSRAEALVLETLRGGHALSLEDVAERVPELSCNILFQAVDALSRRGGVRLQRKGFTYFLSLPPSDHLSAKVPV